jgi:predicted membrane channel-forming protein YqfA (hemolysin III family)
MGLIIIFALITILAAFGVLRALKSRNYLATFWSVTTFLVFGWFVVMSVVNNGIPTGTH